MPAVWRGHQDVLSGLAAAAMAFLGIWAANAMMLASVFANPEKFFDVEVNEVAVEQPMDNATDAEAEQAEEEIADEETAEGEMAEEEMAEDIQFDEDIPAGARTAVLGIALVIGSFIMCFAGIFKIICLILALSSAYKIGSNGGFGS